jgi:hypothetical protein
MPSSTRQACPPRYGEDEAIDIIDTKLSHRRPISASLFFWFSKKYRMKMAI